MKHIRRAAAAICVVTMAVLQWCASQPPHPINTANYARIEVGMTEDEVVTILGSCDPDDENIQEQVHGDGRSVVKCWSRQSRGSIRDTVIVGFEHKDGRWIVENKYSFIPSVWDRIGAWWGGYEILPDRYLPHMPVGGRSKTLKEAA